MFAVDELIGRLAQLLTDEDFDFWNRDFHRSSIEEAVHVLARLRPDATARRVDMPLVEGFAQRLPADAARLIEVTAVDGRGLTRQSEALLNKLDPCWRKAEQIAGVESFVPDEVVDAGFFVYPPARGGEVASVAYSALLTVEHGGQVDLGDEYVKHVTNYCLYRAYQREGTQSQKEGFYRQAFYDGLGIMYQASQAAAEQVAA